MSIAAGGADARTRDLALISLDEACRRAALHARPINRIERVALIDAIDRVLAEDLRAEVALPPFDQSAMDGYAFAAASIKWIDDELPVALHVAAGSRADALPEGTAARVFTGSPIPVGADTVVMQEHVRRKGGHIAVDGLPRLGSNIRRRGEDIATGELLLEAGQRLGPHHIALLAAQGLAEVGVCPRPRVLILSTGDELRQPGDTLERSGCLRLESADAAGARASGGSLGRGRRLHVRQPRRDCASTGRVRQKRGFHRHDRRRVSWRGRSFRERPHSNRSGFRNAADGGEAWQAGHRRASERSRISRSPGNPVAALVSWLTLGHAMIAALSGTPWRRQSGIRVPVISGFERAAGRNEFVPARLIHADAGQQLEILGRGGSARLKPLIHADGLAEIGATTGTLEPGDDVNFHPFRGGFSV